MNLVGQGPVCLAKGGVFGPNLLVLNQSRITATPQDSFNGLGSSL